MICPYLNQKATSMTTYMFLPETMGVGNEPVVSSVCTSSQATQPECLQEGCAAWVKEESHCGFREV